jgi:TIR domain
MGTPLAAPKPESKDFDWDVFLSYRKPDFVEVSDIAHRLKDHGVRVWWDEWNARPGFDFQDSLADGLRRSWATAVFIGPNTVAGWQEREVKSAINTQAQSQRPVMAVFLPGAGDPDTIEIPAFLGLNTRIVFKISTDEDEPLKRMIWGIKGVNPYATAAPKVAVETTEPPGTVAAVNSAVAFLSSWIRTGRVTFFVGPAASQVDPALPPRDFEIAVKLLQELKLIESDENGILPPLDVAATIYGMGKSDPVLEMSVVSQIAARSTCSPPTHANLAQLLKKLMSREKPRGRRLEKQLVITTNIDVIMERELLRAGVGFTRLVQHKSDKKLYLANYHGLRTAHLNDDGLLEVIFDGENRALAPEQVTGAVLEEPVLFKLRGSQDIPGSCALTRPQLLHLGRTVITEKLLPDELLKITDNTPIVLLGTGVLAPDFQYLANTLLFNAWESDHGKYLIQLSPEHDTGDPYRRMEAGIWEEIKQTAMRKKLTPVEEHCDRFVARLIAGLEGT